MIPFEKSILVRTLGNKPFAMNPSQALSRTGGRGKRCDTLTEVSLGKASKPGWTTAWTMNPKRPPADKAWTMTPLISYFNRKVEEACCATQSTRLLKRQKGKLKGARTIDSLEGRCSEKA